MHLFSRSLYFLANLLIPASLIGAASGWIMEYLPTIYILHFLLMAAGYKVAKDRQAFLCSPAFLTLVYVCVSFALGSWAFSQGYVYVKRDLEDYYAWAAIKTTTIFMLLCNIAVVAMYFLTEKKPEFKERREDEAGKPRWMLMAFLAVVPFVFLVVPVGLEALGGQGSFKIFPQSTAALALCLLAREGLGRARFVVYGAVIVVFSALSYEDKSYAIFFFITIFFLEVIKSRDFRISFRLVSILLAAVSASMILILAMSIKRGYGSFGDESFLGSFKHIAKYVRSDAFISMFFNNLEVNYTFFHSSQAMEYAQAEPWTATLGSTLVKPLFIPVPRKFFRKPQSMIHHYTHRRDPVARERGQSWPVNVYAEMFWNLRWLGLAPLLLVYFAIHKAYFKLVALVRKGGSLAFVPLLFAYHTFLFYPRGAGLDMYLLDFLFACLAWLLIRGLPRTVYSLVRAGVDGCATGKRRAGLESPGQG